MKFINTVEKYLVRIVVLSLLLVVVVQGLMTSDPVRFYLSWAERMEGQTIQYPVSAETDNDKATAASQVKSPEALITIAADKYSSLPQAKVMVNGQGKFSFAENPLDMKVRAGDVIEIDASFYNFPVDFKVSATSENLAYPLPGHTVRANQTVVMLGKIIVK